LHDLIFVSIFPTYGAQYQGHRYFFFRELHAYLDKMGIENYMIVPLKARNSRHDLMSTYYIEGMSFNDGVDFGINSPFKLKRILQNAFQDSMGFTPNKRIVLHTYETSLSLALAILNLKNIDTKLINIQEPGFWLKFFRNRSTSVPRRILRYFYRENDGVQIFTEGRPMVDALAKKFDKGIEEYPVASAISPQRKTNNRVLKRAVIIEGDINLMKASALEILSNTDWVITIFARTEQNASELNIWQKNLKQEHEMRVLVISHYPDFNQYVELFEGAVLCVFTYVDDRHINSSSGILADSLILCHQIVVATSALSIKAEQWQRDRITRFERFNATSFVCAVEEGIIKGRKCLEKEYCVHLLQEKPDVAWLVKKLLKSPQKVKTQRSKYDSIMFFLANISWHCFAFAIKIRNVSNRY
jgi:hypothetical protein